MICMHSQYPYRDMDGSKVVLHLIHITINTLNAQYHSCRPHATAGPLYSDNSNMSRYSEKEKGEVKQMWRSQFRSFGADCAFSLSVCVGFVRSLPTSFHSPKTHMKV